APVHARQGHRELLAGEMALELDADLRARRMVARRGAKGAGQRPELRSAERRGQAVLSADECVAYFHREGWAERILATGSVRGSVHGPGGEDRLEAQQLEVEMLPEFMAPKVLIARGDVKAQSSHRGESRSLATSALRFYFVDPTKPREQRLGHAETLAPATIEWQRPNAPGGNGEPQAIRLRGQQIAAEFGEHNDFRNLTGRGALNRHFYRAKRGRELGPAASNHFFGPPRGKHLQRPRRLFRPRTALAGGCSDRGRFDRAAARRPAAHRSRQRGCRVPPGRGFRRQPNQRVSSHKATGGSGARRLARASGHADLLECRGARASGTERADAGPPRAN